MFIATGLPWVDQAVFTPQVGDPVSLNVIFEREIYDDYREYETKISDDQYRIEMLFADIGQKPVAATPTRNGDFFVINNLKYEVTEVTERNNKFISCSVKLID